jgi:hypothetical protein
LLEGRDIDRDQRVKSCTSFKVDDDQYAKCCSINFLYQLNGWEILNIECVHTMFNQGIVHNLYTGGWEITNILEIKKDKRIARAKNFYFLLRLAFSGQPQYYHEFSFSHFRASLFQEYSRSSGLLKTNLEYTPIDYKFPQYLKWEFSSSTKFPWTLHYI